MFFGGAGEDEDEDPPPRFVDLKIGRIRYVMRGEGPTPLLLIHGFGGDLDNWVFNIDAFDDIATVYALDLPGHGQSVKTMAQRPLAGLVRTVLDFMDRLGIASAHIVGHSLGGLVALVMAKQVPARLRSLLLINSAGLGVELNDAYLRRFIAAWQLAELKPVLEQLFADPERLSQPMMQEFLRYKSEPGVMAALLRLYGDMVHAGRQRRILTDVVRKLTIPVHAVAGKQDQVIPPRHTFALRDAVKVTIVPGAGHMLPMEKYRSTNDFIRDMLST